MKTTIERMPSDTALELCREAWNLTDLTFVRKMENIVFSCNRHNRTVFLRLTTLFRRSKLQIEAELHFVTHLATAGLLVPNIIPNANGHKMMTIQDRELCYEAVVFSQVDGEHPSLELVTTPDFLIKLGTVIATMHQVSKKYEPLAAREHWHEERGIRHALEAATESTYVSLREKLNAAMQWIGNLEKTPETYGLVHADLGAGNLFVQSNGSIGVIDFDDACHHFYAFDLAIVIYSMTNRFGNVVANDQEKEWLSHLIEGYERSQPLTQSQIQQIPYFMHFACLRLYFWIEYHQALNTFHDNAIEKVLKMKQWAFNRIHNTTL